MTVTWKPQEERFGGGESCFGIGFREAHPDIAKLLSDDKGFYVDKKETTVNGYTYKCRVVQNGKYIFITRKATTTIPSQPPKPPLSNEEGAKRGHEENIQMHKERMEMDAKLLDALQKLAAAIEVREAIEDTMRQHIENIDRNIMKLLPLPTAKDLVAKEEGK